LSKQYFPQVVRVKTAQTEKMGKLAESMKRTTCSIPRNSSEPLIKQNHPQEREREEGRRAVNVILFKGLPLHCSGGVKGESFSVGKQRPTKGMKDDGGLEGISRK
jgi:hypothetical protein